MKKCFLCGEVHPYSRRTAQRLQATTPARLRRLLAGLSGAQLRRRPAPQKWSIIEIANHLLDVEITYGFRFRKIVAEPGSSITPMDQNLWARGLNYRGQSPRQLLEAFSALRRQHLTLLAGLSGKQWRQWARHPEYPKLRYQLEPVFIHLASHDLNHLGQIAALRRRWSRHR